MRSWTLGGLPSYVPQKIHPKLGATYSCMFAHNPYGDWFLRIGINASRQGFSLTRDSLNWGTFKDTLTGQIYTSYGTASYNRFDIELPFTFMKRIITPWGLYAAAGFGVRIGLWWEQETYVKFGDGSERYGLHHNPDIKDNTNIFCTASLGVVKPLNEKFDILIETRYTNLMVPISISLAQHTMIPYAWGIGLGITRRKTEN
jgi:hypothetical protein